MKLEELRNDKLLLEASIKKFLEEFQEKWKPHGVVIKSMKARPVMIHGSNSFDSLRYTSTVSVDLKLDMNLNPHGKEKNDHE